MKARLNHNIIIFSNQKLEHVSNEPQTETPTTYLYFTTCGDDFGAFSAHIAFNLIFSPESQVALLRYPSRALHPECFHDGLETTSRGTTS